MPSRRILVGIYCSPLFDCANVRPSRDDWAGYVVLGVLASAFGKAAKNGENTGLLGKSV